MTKDVYVEVNAKSPMFGLDCEMCKTTTGELELTRISLVDESMKVSSILQLLYKEGIQILLNSIADYL